MSFSVTEQAMRTFSSSARGMRAATESMVITSTPPDRQSMSTACTSTHQRFCLSRCTGKVTPKIMNFHYLKKKNWDESIQKIYN